MRRRKSHRKITLQHRKIDKFEPVRSLELLNNKNFLWRNRDLYHQDDSRIRRLRDENRRRLQELSIRNNDKFHKELYRKSLRIIGKGGLIDPIAVKVCARRRAVREVLLAGRKAGKGIKGPKKKKYTEESQIRC